MATATLVHYIDGVPEGTDVVDSFQYSEDVSPYFFDEVNGYLENLIDKFIVSNRSDTPFALLKESEFDIQEEDEGYVYFETPWNDSRTPISDNSWEAARTIVIGLVGSEYWNERVVNIYDGRYAILDADVNDIPVSAPSIPAKPVDPRFEKGDTVYNINGLKFKYQGVLFDPIRNKISTYASPDYTSKSVRIGVKNNEYANAKAVEELMLNEDIEIHPLPLAYTSGMRKKTAPKVFARMDAYPDKEGLGKTIEEAKFELALSILIERKRYR